MISMMEVKQLEGSVNSFIKILNAEPINYPAEGYEEDLPICTVSVSVDLDFSSIVIYSVGVFKTGGL